MPAGWPITTTVSSACAVKGDAIARAHSSPRRLRNSHVHKIILNLRGLVLPVRRRGKNESVIIRYKVILNYYCLYLGDQSEKVICSARGMEKGFPQSRRMGLRGTVVKRGDRYRF